MIFSQYFIVKQALIVIKKTKFELDEMIYPDRDFYRKITTIQNNSYDRIFHSHERQLESRKILQNDVFTEGKFVFRDELDYINPANFDLMISLGGDNHFTYVAHHAGGTKILGCNSDSFTSRGALLSFTPETLRSTVHENWQNTEVEEWSMIYAKLVYPDNTITETVSCVNEISIRNTSPDLTSRYVIQYDGFTEEQKSSGLLLYTGAGSTGWYASCKGLGDFEVESFLKSADYFKLFSRELSRKAREHFKFTDMKIYGTLRVISEMNGGISIDSLTERYYPFPPGTIADIQLSPIKLKVIKLKR
ncbi:MAG: NAD+ kinase [Spirochaetia bacterium]|nr:NAD+ kinase [Spirochaetia bacterium]